MIPLPSIVKGFHLASGGYITSVQQVAITISNGNSSATASISSVNTSLSFIVFQGTNTDNTTVNASNISVRIELTNSTTVTAYRSGTTNSVTVYAAVVQCSSSLVSSIQRGTINLSGTANSTATITSVDTTRAAVFFLGATCTDTSTTYGFSQERLALTNATTVTGSGFNVRTATIGYVVVEFQTAVIQSVQFASLAANDSSSTTTATISSVNTANSFMAYAGSTANNVSIPICANYVELTNSTTVTTTRSSSNASNRATNVFVIEFVSGVVKTNQVGLINITTTSNTSTISSVNTTTAICGQYYFDCVTVTSPAACTPATVLTNATTVTSMKNTTGSSATSSFYVLELN